MPDTRPYPSTVEEALSDEFNRGFILKPVYPILPTAANGGDCAIELADCSLFWDAEMNRVTFMVAFLGFGFVVGYCFGASRTQVALREVIAKAQAYAAEMDHDPDCPNHPDNAPDRPSVH